MGIKITELPEDLEANLTDVLPIVDASSGKTKKISAQNLRAGLSTSTHLHDDRYYTEAEMDTKLAAKSDTTHLHDDRYYTETEVDSKLAAKSNSTHLHDDRYYTETEVDSALAGKAATAHNHTSANITDLAETIEDTIGTKIVAGTNVTVTYDDTTGNTTIASSGGGGSLAIQEEGTALTQRSTLNFIGSAVTAADDSVNSRTNVTIDAAPSSHTHAAGNLDSLSDVTLTTPTNGQVLKYDGTAWINDTDGGSSLPAQTGNARKVLVTDGTSSSWVSVNPGLTTYTIAASNSSARDKAVADYVCDGTGDEVEINSAIAALTEGGIIRLAQGTFNLAATISIVGKNGPGDSPLWAIIGAGPEGTILAPASGIHAITLTESPKVRVHDVRINLAGLSNGIQCTAPTVGAGDRRGFWMSHFQNLKIQGDFSTHTGWAMNLESPFRSTFMNIQGLGIKNGIRLASHYASFNPGNLVFQDCHMDLSQADGTAYFLDTHNDGGFFNICTFIECDAIDSNGSSTASIGWRFKGSTTTYFTTRDILVLRSNVELFNTAVSLEHSANIEFNGNYMDAKNNGTLFKTTADSPNNQLSVQYGYAAPAKTIKVLDDLNAVIERPTTLRNSFLRAENHATTPGAFTLTKTGATVLSGLYRDTDGTGTYPAEWQGQTTALVAKDEGTELFRGTRSVNFTGSGVTATTSGPDVTVTIPGGISQADADTRYVNTTGDTLSGELKLGTGGDTPYLTFGDSFKVRGSFGHADILPLFTAKQFRFLDTAGVIKTQIDFDSGAVTAASVNSTVTAGTVAPVTATIDAPTSTTSAFLAKNHTNFAHGGNIIRAEMKNATDTGNVVEVVNEGSGKSLRVTKAGAEKFSVDTDGKAAVLGFQLGTAATAGHVLTADASGNGTWQAAAGGGGGQTIYTHIVAASGGTHTTLGAALAAATVGDSILVREGTYTETAAVSSALGEITIVGESLGAIIDMAGFDLTLSGAKVTVKNLRFTSTTGSINFSGESYADTLVVQHTGTTGKVLTMTGANCRLSNSFFESSVSAAATQFNFGGNAIIEHNHFVMRSDMTGAEGAMHFQSTHITFANNNVNSYGGDGKIIGSGSFGGGWSNITGNIFRCAGGLPTVVYLQSGDGHAIISNNIMLATGKGIEMAGGFGYSISGNVINAENFGIYLGGSGLTTITGNRIKMTSGAGSGIGLVCRANSVTGNFIGGFSTTGTGSGIIIYDNQDNNVLTGNRAFENGSGIKINGVGADTTVVCGNNLKDNGTSLSDAGTGTVVSGNAV